jgi:hypothetical protein
MNRFFLPLGCAAYHTFLLRKKKGLLEERVALRAKLTEVEV